MLLDVRNGKVSTSPHICTSIRITSVLNATCDFQKKHFMGVNGKRNSVASTRKLVPRSLLQLQGYDRVSITIQS